MPDKIKYTTRAKYAKEYPCHWCKRTDVGAETKGFDGKWICRDCLDKRNEK